MQNKNKRIYILGVSGSGKSTLAKMLAKRYKVPYYDLDDVYWAKKYSIKRTLEERKEKSDKLALRDNWVIEGVYSNFTDGIIKRATTVIWINIPIMVSLYRITRRHLCGGDSQANMRSFLKLFWALARGKTKKGMQYKQKMFIKKHDIKNLIIIKNQKKTEKYLEKIQ